ncbi:MAG TPA: C4-dicarboxylate transporter DctA [Caulobacteraceae bacterium]|jgi:aerobic C4-dicarboxylate transport protein|nr:C4-dicarboxylate transporter DctA [Caulobacteraceae bacterium]
MKLVSSLYFQVIVGILLGVVVGVAWPHLGVALKPLGDGFVKLIKMLIGPIIFCTVAGGIARMSDLRRVGTVGVRALVYFEAVSTLALVIGIAVAELVKPGVGFNVDPHSLDPAGVGAYVSQARKMGGVADYLLHLIPDTFVSAFADGDVLQILLLAILTGFAIAGLKARADMAAAGLERIGEVFFAIIRIVVRAAPLGAFGAMGYTLGKYGPAALLKLGALVGCVYLTSALFVALVLGLVARACGFSLWRLLLYIREELFIVLGASSSEAALPQLMAKLERLGAPKAVVGLVVPAGYSFNLDGTNIYMTLATLFLAQATNTPLTLGQEGLLLLVAMLTSKGASGVAGAGFITLALTLSAVGVIPVAAMALILGVDRFLSEGRALTNVIGNGVATLAVARWEGTLDSERLAEELARGSERNAALDTMVSVS